jgi:formamidopyrimidine-DNA glycosylase
MIETSQGVGGVATSVYSGPIPIRNNQLVPSAARSMPELPEVETMRRGILAIVGSHVREIEILECTRRPIAISPTLDLFRQAAVGQRIAAVDRLGKRVVVRLANEHSILFEPRMTGLVLVADPPSDAHLRFRMELRGGPIRHVWYWDRRGLGNVRLASTAELAVRLGQTLGPDALTVTAAELQQRLGRGKQAIKVALLDQRKVAGIGNLYAAEILHLAGIHPERPCLRLRLRDWERLHACMRQVLEAAIDHEGSTLSDGTYRNALNQSGNFQNHHRVYDRAGEMCRTCGVKPVERIVQAQRATFYCRKCQPRR